MVKIAKEIYGLPQVSLLAKRRLDIHLAAHGYHESSTLRLYKHISRPIIFTLVVEDFGINKSQGQAGPSRPSPEHAAPAVYN
jgi:hypothetical protein